MTYTINISQSWQIYIPVAIRKELKLTRPTRAEIFVEGDAIVIKPVKPDNKTN